MRYYIILAFIFAYSWTIGQENPFYIYQQEPTIQIPDSISKIELNGYSVLQLKIDRKGTLYDVILRKLLINNKSDERVINYINTNACDQQLGRMPENISVYYNFLKKYVYTLKIRNNSKIKPAENNDIIIMVRLE